MRRSSTPVWRLSAAFIERAHDVGINLVWPGIEPVRHGSCLDLNLLHSAASQPYQEVFGRELYPSLAAKAAYLMCHLATSHVFSNGNKRTAVLCLDQFLLANGQYLTLSNRELHDLAQDVASSGERGASFAAELLRVTELIEVNTVPLRVFRLTDARMYRRLHATKTLIRTMDINHSDYPLSQSR